MYDRVGGINEPGRSTVAVEHGPRIGLSVAGDPLDPAGYSGLPAALAAALTRRGVDLVPVETTFPSAVDRLVTNALALTLIRPRDISRRDWSSLEAMRRRVRSYKPRVAAGGVLWSLSSAVAASRVRRSGPLDACIQFGSEYRLPSGLPYVTLDDATIIQLRRSYPYAWMQSVPAPTMDAMIVRQRSIFRGARACCLLNEWAARSAVEDYGVDSSRVFVVGTGPNIDGRPSERSWDRPRFLFVGKDFQRKNGHRVLVAFQHVRRLHRRAELDVVGGHPRLTMEGVRGHGPLRLDRREDRERLGGLFSRATCLVMPSLLEPTGNVHAEALAAGIPSIGTIRGGVATVIGDAGVLVDPEDDVAIRDAMLTMCEKSELLRFHARACRRAPLFTWDAMAGRVLRALALPAWPPETLPLPL